MNEKVKMVLVLGGILIFSLSVLSAVNFVTAPVILQNDIIKQEAALKSLFPQATEFKERPDYMEVYQDSDLIGYISTGVYSGYSSEVEVMVGFNIEKNIIDIQILSQQETPGLGSNIEKEEFIKQFRNRQVESEKSIALKKYGGELDAVTGATISSNAVTKAIQLAYEKLP